MTEITIATVNNLPAMFLFSVFIFLILVCEKIFTQQRSLPSFLKVLHNLGEELHHSHRNDSNQRL